MNKQLNIVGKIKTDLYSCVSEKILTDEVILNPSQEKHANEDHDNVYVLYGEYVPNILLDPDFLLEDNKHKDTVLVIKKGIGPDGVNINLVLKLIIEGGENPDYKNSIITMWKISDKKLNQKIRQSIRKEKLLYKKNDNC